MQYRDWYLSRGLQVLIFCIVSVRQPFGARLFLLRIFFAFRQRSHFDAVVFQDFFGGPTNVWNCAIASPGFCSIDCVLQRWFSDNCVIVVIVQGTIQHH